MVKKKTENILKVFSNTNLLQQVHIILYKIMLNSTEVCLERILLVIWQKIRGGNLNGLITDRYICEISRCNVMA